MTARPTPPRRPAAPVSAAPLGMWVFLASLTMLFAASLVGYLVVRARAETWRPEGVPNLPAGLWVSTAVIVLCSVAIHRAVVAIRNGRQQALVAALLATLALGVGFLVLQAFNWLQLWVADVTPRRGLYGFTFYVLTGLHAVHVVGGLVPLAFTIWRAVRGRYTWAAHTGVRTVAMYWHFLDVVWIVMFIALWSGG